MDSRNEKKNAKGKICSACQEHKSLSDYYSKGGRADSACKECQKRKKKTKYVATKNHDVVAGLSNIINLSTTGLIQLMKAETERLEKVIACLKKQKQ